MASAIMASLTELFKSQFLSQTAAQLGESESSISRGFEASSATIVGSIGNKASQPGFLQQIFDLVKSPENDPHMMDNPAAFQSSGEVRPGETMSGKLLSMVFGGQQPQISEMIARSAGLRTGSASTLMSMAAPLVLGFLGKRVRQGGLDMSGFSTLLQQEGSSVASHLPTGMASLLGLSPARPETVHHPVHAESESRKWVAPLVIGLALLGGLLWMTSRGRRDVSQLADRASGSASRAVEEIRSQADSVKNMLSRKLANGTELSVPAGGFEDRLITVISDPGSPNSTEWIEFDRLTFGTGSSTLNPDSQEQLTNVATILKAYPGAHAKVGGYTDNSGDARDNQKLSQARADAVKQDLVEKGVSADRIEAEGFGEQHPVADNTTEEGRARNRRIAMLVIQK